jgi:hypothetical protein
MTEITYKRPGLVTFASIMMFIVGGLSLVWSIEEFSNAVWLRDVSFGLFGQQFAIWAIIDLILAVVALVAGYSIWQGGKFGWWVGMIVAVISAVRWFFYIPWVPVAALVVIAIDVLIIYGLSAHWEYFDQ